MISTARGAKVYEGQPCRHCQGTERYAANYNCVACHRKQGRLNNERCKLRNRKLRAARRASPPPPQAATTEHGAAVYEGRRCHRGHSLRYWSNLNCVACVLASDERRKVQINRRRRETRAARRLTLQNNQKEISI